MNSRATASLILNQVLHKNVKLESALQNEKPIVQEIVYGVLRYFNRLRGIAQLLLKKPFKKKDNDIELLLLGGIYQILYLDQPEFACVNETVNATKSLRKTWAQGVINATLRKCIREKEALIEQIDQKLTLKTAHPQWLIDKFQQDWPSHWQSILDYNNQRPPMSLRVNQRCTSRGSVLAQLENATAYEHSDTAIRLATPRPVTQIPGFSEGHVSVQDISAQLAIPLLNVESGMHVLDAAAAPGGKYCHLLESCPDISAIAIDIQEKRLHKIQENLDRLQLSGNLICANAADTERWWDGKPFDRILLDTPCSGSGVIRRHPDSKWLRSPESIEQLTQLQSELLNKLWPLLKVGGRMLYATCSIFHDENEKNIEKFIASHKDAEIIKIEKDFGMALKFGRQILANAEQDGFYYCLMAKK